MANPVLYMIVPSPPCSAVLMLADLLGIPLDKKLISWENLEHKTPEYLKMNPMGTVPTLKDGDFVVSDSHAIMEYLIAKRGAETSLYPSELRARSTVDQVMYFEVGVFFTRSDVAIRQTMVGNPPTPDQKKDLDTAYGVIEAYLGNRKYIAADHLTLADLSVGTTAVFTQVVHKIDEKRFPRTVDWLARLEKEEFFSKYCVPGVADFIKHFVKC